MVKVTIVFHLGNNVFKTEASYANQEEASAEKNVLRETLNGNNGINVFTLTDADNNKVVLIRASLVSAIEWIANDTS
jgi:hypothetical protein